MTICLHGHCGRFRLVTTTHLTTRTGSNKSLKIEDQIPTSSFERQAETHIPAGRASIFSPWTVFEQIYYFKLCRVVHCWLQRHREKYFRAHFFLLSPAIFYSLQIPLEAVSCYFSRHPPCDGGSGYRELLLDHINTGTNARLHTETLCTDNLHFTQEYSRNR